MTGQVFTILFREDKAFLAKDSPLSFEHLDLPPIAKSFKSPACWTIKVLNYDDQQKKIFAEILSYEVGETRFSPAQLLLADKLKGIRQIKFRSIDTTGLLKTMAGTTAYKKIPKPEAYVYRDEEMIPAALPVVREPVMETIKETFPVPVKDLRFKLGGVSFEKKIKGFHRPIEFTVVNYELREEFDAIKDYFENVLKTKKIRVTVSVETKDHELVNVLAKSPEIDRIDRQLIDTVKFEFVKTAKKKIATDIDKSLFTMDEFFDSYGDERFRANVFYNDEKELFEDLLQITGTKHYRQLRLLSGLHCHGVMKLRFILKPFSFLFLVEGEKNYHLIWETLDTEEATYIWHIEKNLPVLKMTLQKIEDIIHVIKVQGKTAYLNTTGDPFRRIFHDYSNLVDGFLKWKGELESVLR
jgi:hypothetical protein